MATETQNIFITKKQKLKCSKCGKPVPAGERFVAESEDLRGTCFSCSAFTSYTLLPSGNAAMTRRSKKHSLLCGVLLHWNQKRRRHERKGIYVEAIAIIKAKQECEDDQETRERKNIKAAEKRAVQNKEYILNFGKAIRVLFPKCPPKREFEISAHACEKYSGRVGRTAHAKEFDSNMIELAVIAHIRHVETNYDSRFGKGQGKKEIRADLNGAVRDILNSWRV